MTKDVNICLMDFPNTKDREMVAENEDGSYSVFVNAKLSYDGRLKAYFHALNHIKRDDFKGCGVQSIETAAHELSSKKGGTNI